MSMQATTLDILIEKAHFDPKVARAVAEAIDNEIQGSQPVTVPVLDIRLTVLRSDLRVEIHDAAVSLERRMYAALFGQLAALLGMIYFFTAHIVR
jgi:hypothetical protein